MSDDSSAPSGPSAPAIVRGPITLAIDIGGTALKAGLLDGSGAIVGERVRVRTMHPSLPGVVVAALVGMARPLGAFERISVGFPGVVDGGLVRTAPHLGTTAWAGFDLAGALQRELGRPVRMLNDATVQGLGVIAGRGLECVITLGTGFGFALYWDGQLTPHLEMSQHVAWKDMTYDQYVGGAAMVAIGKSAWRLRVKRILKQLRVVVNFDTLYIGGGGAKFLDFDLAVDMRIVSNDAGITGGVKLWDARLAGHFG